MQEIQLEFNIDNVSREELKFREMQKQIDTMVDSMGKVRRKLFAEIGEMKKLYLSLEAENAELRNLVKKSKWNYAQGDNLFALEDGKEAVG